MRSINGHIGIGTKTTDEAESGVVYRHKSVNVSIAEHVNVESVLIDLSDGIGRDILEGDLVVTRKVKGLDVLELAGCKQEPVRAEKAGRLLGINGDCDVARLTISSQVLAEAELNVLETLAVIVGDRLGLGVQCSHVNWDKEACIIGSKWVDVTAVVARVDFVKLHALLVNLILGPGQVKGAGLALIISSEMFP